VEYRSYPTYEEWKPAFCSTTFSTSSGSYPTYEEWKPQRLKKDLGLTRCSYPTYEEWKHICSVVYLS